MLAGLRIPVADGVSSPCHDSRTGAGIRSLRRACAARQRFRTPLRAAAAKTAIRPWKKLRCEERKAAASVVGQAFRPNFPMCSLPAPCRRAPRRSRCDAGLSPRARSRRRSKSRLQIHSHPPLRPIDFVKYGSIFSSIDQAMGRRYRIFALGETPRRRRRFATSYGAGSRETAPLASSMSSIQCLTGTSDAVSR